MNQYDRKDLRAEPGATSLSTGSWYKETKEVKKKKKKKCKIIKNKSSVIFNQTCMNYIYIYIYIYIYMGLFKKFYASPRKSYKLYIIAMVTHTTTYKTRMIKDLS